MEMSPSHVESRQLQKGCDGDGCKALLQFPKQRGDRAAASVSCTALTEAVLRKRSKLTCEIWESGAAAHRWRQFAARHPEGQPCFRTTGREPQPC